MVERGAEGQEEAQGFKSFNRSYALLFLATFPVIPKFFSLCLSHCLDLLAICVLSGRCDSELLVSLDCYLQKRAYTINVDCMYENGGKEKSQVTKCSKKDMGKEERHGQLSPQPYIKLLTVSSDG